VSAPGGYALDNHHGAAVEHHRALAELLDAGTRRRILSLPGWPRVRRCLEIGAGAGSMSRWLARQLPAGGVVLACDLKPELLAEQPNLVPVGHDLTSDVPLVDVFDRGYDLILARMTLQHLPDRRRLVRELAGLLAAGGTLLVEDWAALRAPADEVVICAPSPEAAQLFRTCQAAIGEAFDSAGADRGWALRVHRHLRAAGLVNVRTEYGSAYWTGGDPGLRLVATSAAQLRPRLLAAGVAACDLDRLAELVRDPELVVRGHPLYSSSGEKPA
jgi:SAM-dependent methyltransferase